MANYNLPASSCYFNGKLHQQLHDDFVLAGLAPRTIHGYLRAVRQLADLYQKTPNRLTEEQIRQWLIHLKENHCFSPKARYKIQLEEKVEAS